VDVTNLKVLLYFFEDFSGLSINFAKSFLVYFGKFDNRGVMLTGILNCTLDSLPLKYMSLPSNPYKQGRRKLQPLIDKFYKKNSCWKGSTLSIGGRVILINYVLSALPLYYLSFFKIPSWVIKKIDIIRSKFL